MKNNERALGASLILHLLLTLIESALMLLLGAVFKNATAVKIFSLLFTPVRFLLPVLLYRRASGYTPFTEPINSGTKPKKTAVSKTALTYVLALSLTVAVLNTVGSLTDTVFSFFGIAVGKSIPLSPFDTVYTFLRNVLFAAILEEALFRGALLHALSGRKAATRILLSATLFALMHGSLYQLFYAAAAGAIIASFTVITGSLKLAAAVHLGANTVSFIFSLLSVHLPAETYKTVSLAVLAAFAATALLSAAVYLCKYRKKSITPADSKITCSLPKEIWAYIAASALVILINLI